jgi:predicted MFS family arabinose efflux permease
MQVGCTTLAVGVALTIIAITASIPALLFAGTAVAGCGYGLGFLGAFRTLVSLAKAERRSELIAAVYVVAYLSFSIPSIIAGILVTHVGLSDTAIGYGVIVAALALAALPATARHCRRC